VILYDLALMGSMRKICDRAHYLADLDPQYHAFAARLKTLATDFEEKSLLALIETHLDAEKIQSRSTANL
ncbi:MAG: hypothetical protein WCD18_23750, partial [Thermosynechococcaceae cyanobacterium]